MAKKNKNIATMERALATLIVINRNEQCLYSRHEPCYVCICVSTAISCSVHRTVVLMMNHCRIHFTRIRSAAFLICFCVAHIPMHIVRPFKIQEMNSEFQTNGK